MAKEALDAVFAAVDLNAVPTTAPLQVRRSVYSSSVFDQAHVCCCGDQCTLQMLHTQSAVTC